jgi:hypothetical protein
MGSTGKLGAVIDIAALQIVWRFTELTIAKTLYINCWWTFGLTTSSVARLACIFRP